jgi:geranylgeranyl diphosphate synthase type I
MRGTESPRPSEISGCAETDRAHPTLQRAPVERLRLTLLGRPTAVPTSAERTGRLDPGPGFADLLDRFRRELERQLGQWLEQKRESSEIDAHRELIDDLGRLTAQGGKRLRPALVYYSFRACAGDRDSGSRERAAWVLALSTEFLHTYLLIHDDIMDHAETRRGVPSSHARFRTVHADRGLRGDGAHFGRSVAILVGDLAHSYAAELFDTAATSLHGAARSGELARCFATMCEEVIGGQYLEMLLAQRGPEAPPEAADLTSVLRLKSGRYTAERPLQLGALLAGAGAETIAALSRYGTAMGEAFQLQDDLLGMFGDTHEVGKPVGGDLLEGKFTFLIHHALAAADESGKKLLEATLGNPQTTTEEIAEVQKLLVSSGARSAVEAMVEARLNDAREALAGLPVGSLSDEGRTFLFGVLDYLKERRQ